MQINPLDIFAVLLILYCMYRGSKVGIANTIVGIVLKVASIFIAIHLYGRLTSIARETSIFAAVQEKISEMLAGRITTSADISAVEGSEPLTNFFGSIGQYIRANDNAEVYGILNPSSYGEYVTSYLANIAMNIISMFVIYLTVFAVLKLLNKVVLGGVRFITKLPVIRPIDVVGGILGGFLQGTFFMWFGVLAIILLTMMGKLLPLYEMLVSSQVAIYFLKHNPLVDAMFAILN